MYTKPILKLIEPASSIAAAGTMRKLTFMPVRCPRCHADMPDWLIVGTPTNTVRYGWAIGHCARCDAVVLDMHVAARDPEAAKQPKKWKEKKKPPKEARRELAYVNYGAITDDRLAEKAGSRHE